MRSRICSLVGPGHAPSGPGLNEQETRQALAYVIDMNVQRRQLSGTQLAMIGERPANLELGDNQHSEGLPIGRASEELSVGERNIYRAKAVLASGLLSLIDLCDQDRLAVSLAHAIVAAPTPSPTSSPPTATAGAARGKI